MMKKRISNNKGLTLLEIIVTLLLVGITAAMAGMWIVSIANGYIFAKTNMETSQKAQLAMTRLAKEFSAINAISKSSSSDIIYTRYDYNYTEGDFDTLEGHVILSSGGILELRDPNLKYFTLTDHVSEFKLAYCDNVNSDKCYEDWRITSRIIEITLTLAGQDNIPSTFKQRVVPRNI